ncbi:hypothetical protein SAMN05443665_1014137 [Actinomadura meyerae]|uniref:Chain length determinant protein n=1 Tax=Actinomadura meyerae TaxID=240840 RepID=A0A239JE09_9ACTN|nr:hypothetical protein [Actinomadura meyerae]SNT03832.1 hypothetical protein SAMN05443665_1014137 [Actinomadura meyerae]
MTAQTPATPEISLVEAVWRYRLMSLVIVLAALLASVAATQILFGGATATARFAVTDPTNNNNALRVGVVSGQGYATYTAQRAVFAGSTPVMARAAQIVKSKRGPNLTGEQLRGRVQTSSKPDGGVVVVTAKGDSMPEAAIIANAVLQAYQEVTVSTSVEKLNERIQNLKDLEAKVTQDMEQLQPGSRAYKLLANQLAKYQAEESGLLSARSKSNDGVQFIDTADPTAPNPSKLPRNAAIGIALGAILACIVSFLRASAPHRGGRSRPGPVPAGAPAGPALAGPGGGVPELPVGRGYDEYRGRADDGYGIEPPAAPPAGRGRRPRGRQAPPPPPADRNGRPRHADDAGLAAPSASATQMMPAAPPPPPAERDAGRPSRLNGAGTGSSRSGSGSGSASRSSSGTWGTRVASKNSGASAKPPRRGTRAKGRAGDSSAEDDTRPAASPAADPLLGGDDPTRTVEDLTFVTDEQLLSATRPSTGRTPSSSSSSSTPSSGRSSSRSSGRSSRSSSGKAKSAEPATGRAAASDAEPASAAEGEGKEDSSLMRYDADR